MDDNKEKELIALKKIQGGLFTLQRALFKEYEESPDSSNFDSYMCQVDLLLDQVDALKRILEN